MFIRYLRRANARTYIHSTHGRPLCDASLHSKGHLQLELLVSVPRLVWSSSFIQTVRCEFAVSQFDFGMATSVLTSTLVVLLWALSLTVLVLSPSVGFIPKPSSLQGDEVDDDGTAAAASTANNVLATTPTDTVVAMAAMIAISVLCSVLVVVLHQRHVFVLDTARRAIGGLVVGTGFMWVVVVVLGAALLDNILSTLLLSCLLASLTLLMPSLLFGLRIKDWQRALVLFKFQTSLERMTAFTTYATLFAAWCSSLALTLDWDRAWQTYPVPIGIAAVLSFAVTSSTMQIVHSILEVTERTRTGPKRE
ncbi:GPI biosynthesis protein family Pig-F [Plasmodiophora brassicae]|nr:hypothetical protein PBRA_005314 [Plasmodiophora brassicae]